MSITTLYAELVVVGTGALLFILLFFHAFIGDWSWFAKLKGLESSTSLVILIPALSIVYLLGILIANLTHLLFQPWEELLRSDPQNLGPDHKREYERIRNEFFTHMETTALVHEFEFRRSKVRICRGWFLNSILIALALLVCLCANKVSAPLAWFGIIACTLIAVGSAVSWKSTTQTELEWLKSYAVKLAQDAQKH